MDPRFLLWHILVDHWCHFCLVTILSLFLREGARQAKIKLFIIYLINRAWINDWFFDLLDIGFEGTCQESGFYVEEQNLSGFSCLLVCKTW